MKTKYALAHATYGLFMGISPDYKCAYLSKGLSVDSDLIRPKAFPSEAEGVAWFNTFFSFPKFSVRDWFFVPAETNGKDEFEPEDLVGTYVEKFALPLIMAKRNQDGCTIH